AKLTQREMEILQQIVAGKTKKEIAADLKLRAKTVGGYRANIMDGLRIHKTAGIVVVGIWYGFVRLPIEGAGCLINMKIGLQRWLWRCLVFLAASAVYLYGFPAATLSYEALVLLHVLVGVVFSALLVLALAQRLKGGPALAKLGWVLLATGAALGLILIRI